MGRYHEFAVAKETRGSPFLSLAWGSLEHMRHNASRE